MAPVALLNAVKPIHVPQEFNWETTAILWLEWIPRYYMPG